MKRKKSCLQSKVCKVVFYKLLLLTIASKNIKILGAPKTHNETEPAMILKNKERKTHLNPPTVGDSSFFLQWK